MKRSPTHCCTSVALAACASMQHHDQNPYANPFYARYLNTGRRSTRRSRATVERAARESALGQPAQSARPDAAAERLSEGRGGGVRARRQRRLPLLPGLVQPRPGAHVARRLGAASHFAFARTVHYKPGHSAALFQLGLMEEQRNHQRRGRSTTTRKRFTINHSLLDVRVNPRILDSKLVDLALLKAYPNEHARESMSFQATPPGYVQQGLEAASTQPAAKDIVTPAPPVTDPSMQAPPPTPGTPVQPAPQPAKPPV